MAFRSSVLTICFCLLLTSACADSFEDATIYAPYKGLQIISANQFEGVIDENGKWIVPAIFDCVGFADSNTVRVIKDEKWGLYDTEGNILLETIYDYISLHCNDPTSKWNHFAYYVMDGKAGYIYKSEVITAPVYELVPNMLEDECFYEDFLPYTEASPNEAPAKRYVYFTDTTATGGLTLSDITGVNPLHGCNSLESFIGRIRSVYQATTWYIEDERTGALIIETDLELLNAYPYFSNGIVIHDYRSQSDNRHVIVYMNAHGDVLQIIRGSDFAWDMWDMYW